MTILWSVRTWASASTRLSWRDYASVWYAWACVSAHYVGDYTLLFLSKTFLWSLGWCTRQSNHEIDTQSCWPEHIHIQMNHLNSPGCLPSNYSSPQYICFSACIMLWSWYECIRWLGCFPSSFCQPLLLLLPSPGLAYPCTSQIKWFHAKVKSSSCLMYASLSQSPSIPNIHPFVFPRRPSTTPHDIYWVAAGREKGAL